MELKTKVNKISRIDSTWKPKNDTRELDSFPERVEPLFTCIGHVTERGKMLA